MSRILHALAFVAAVVWWLPAIVLVLAQPALFRAGFAYRTRRAHRLLDAGELEEADRLIARLREDAERYRRRSERRFSSAPPVVSRDGE